MGRDLIEASRGNSGVAHLNFTQARGQLTQLFNEVVGEHRVAVVARQGDRDEVAMFKLSDALDMLSSYRFDTQVRSVVGEVVVEVPEVEIAGVGDSFEDALRDASEQIEGYARRYFERRAFYDQTHRAKHWKYLLRFSLTQEEDRLELLLSDSQALLSRELEPA